MIKSSDLYFHTKLNNENDDGDAMKVWGAAKGRIMINQTKPWNFIIFEI